MHATNLLAPEQADTQARKSPAPVSAGLFLSYLNLLPGA
jgi:hypothetical protein